jgi:hypothetical protein
MRSPLPVEADRLVVNTGPLIALGRVDAFDIISRLPVIFIIPKEVADEIEAGARAGLCPLRANAAALTSAVRRETARTARADAICGLSPGSSGSVTPRYRGQHRCGAIILARHWHPTRAGLRQMRGQNEKRT